MMTNRREAAEWALAADAEAVKLVSGVDKALASAAARGFPAPPGDVLEAILAGTLDSKTKLAAMDGKLYSDRRGVLFQQQEFLINILVKLARLSLDLYRSEIFNALEVEQAEWQSSIEHRRADVERHNAETELRQKAIIMAHAQAEQRIIVYKAQLVAEETTTLTAEQILLQAQLATAEKKLEIIASIYKVLASEELVVAADQRRAASLQKVLVAEQALAVVKEAEVPYYLQKAQALQNYAAAIIADLPIQEALIRLGYDRIDLKTTEEYAGHLEREQQEELELLREEFVRANTAAELTRLQNRRLLLEYKNTVQALIETQKVALEKDKIAFKFASGLNYERIGVNLEVADIQHTISNLGLELQSILANMSKRGNDHVDTIRDGAETVVLSASTTSSQQLVRKIFSG